MVVDADTLTTRFPVLSGVSADAIDLAIADSELQCPASQWTVEETRDLGVLYLTAHKLRLERWDTLRQGAALKSIEANEELDIDKIHHSLDYYKKTIYGEQFLRLRKQVVGSGMFVV